MSIKGIKDAVKAEKDKKPLQSTESIIIEQRLNKMFYTMRDNLEDDRVGLHASSIIGGDDSFCYRCQVLSLFFVQNKGHELPVTSLKIFAAGNSIHEKWQNMFIRSGAAVKIEARSFSEKYELYFTPDAIIEMNGKQYVVEIKSMNTYSFKHATSHPSGRKQCMLYMHMLGIPNGFVLAEDKNTQDIKIFPVEYDYSVVVPYLTRLHEVQEMKKAFIKHKELPARHCKNCDTKQAVGCSMRDACWNIGGGRVKL